MTRTTCAALLLILLSGCGAIRPAPDSGKDFTLEHGSARFQDAMQGAREYCGEQGLRARHVGTDRGGDLMLSRFECLEK